MGRGRPLPIFFMIKDHFDKYGVVYLLLGVFFLGYVWGFIASQPYDEHLERNILEAFQNDAHERRILERLIPAFFGTDTSTSEMFKYFDKCNEIMANYEN